MADNDLRTRLEHMVTGTWARITDKPVHVAVIAENGSVYREHYNKAAWARRWANGFFRSGLNIKMACVNDTAHDTMFWKTGRYGEWNTAHAERTDAKAEGG